MNGLLNAGLSGSTIIGEIVLPKAKYSLTTSVKRTPTHNILNMSNNNKVKGLLKGLRFISQIFDNQKEPEIEIGHPTDVKHVAHIGLDGPSESSPSWMNEFQSVPGYSSAPVNLNGDIDIHSKGPDNSVKSVSEDLSKRGSRSVNCQGQEKDSLEMPKSSRQQSTENIRESHAKEKSDRPRQPKKSSKHLHSKNSSNGSKSMEQPMSTDTDSLQLVQGSDLPPMNLSENPKRSRSNKAKEKDASHVGTSSSKSRSKGQPRDPNLNQRPPSRPSSNSSNKQRSFEQDGQFERESSKDILRNYTN